MKGSPIIATGIVIVVLLGLYTGMRKILLPEEAAPTHQHDAPVADTGHNDENLDTSVEIFFSSVPESFTVKDPVTQKVLIEEQDFDEQEWSDSLILSIVGHTLELSVDVTWRTPTEQNFVQIDISPENHLLKSSYLRSDDDISDIAKFAW